MINHLTEKMKDTAKDIRINLTTVLSEAGAPGLSKEQIYGIALACAYTSKHPVIIEAMQHEASQHVAADVLAAAHSAAAIMAMNNIYYRFIHLVEKDTYKQLPARLRMTVLANPGIPKVDFELSCLAVSAINGCGMCMSAHTDVLEMHGMPAEGIQSAIRIAAVMNAVGVSLLS